MTAGICPWNYPLMMAIWKVGPALAAGNVSVIKPAQLTPRTALRLAELSEGILPAGVLNVVTGRGSVIGDQLVKNTKVRLVSVTGDTATGKIIAANAAASNVKRAHLELGGKAPVVVFDDADLDKVVETLKFAGYTNTGQDCTASCRVIAGPSIYEDLLSALVPTVESIKVGPIMDESVEMGPLVSSGQRESVAGFVERAAEGGGKVLTGGERIDGAGFYYKPTVVAGVDQKSEIVQQEVFGPVVSVQRFSDEDQAVAVGERRRVRPRVLRVDQGRGSCDARGPAAAVRRSVGEHPLHDQRRDAARWVQGERVRQGHVDVLARGLHADQACDVVARLSEPARNPGVARPERRARVTFVGRVVIVPWQSDRSS